jgi:hypothetical protein
MDVSWPYSENLLVLVSSDRRTVQRATCCQEQGMAPGSCRRPPGLDTEPSPITSH